MTDEQRRITQARLLRRTGLTYDEFAERTGASKGSISPWVRDMRPHHDLAERRTERSQAANRRSGEMRSRIAAERREEMRRRADRDMGAMTDRDRHGRVALINSDPTVLELFLSWLDLVGVPEADRIYRLSIHESADVPAQERWWAERLRIPLASFSRAVLKRHKPTTSRHNIADTYHGCLFVRIARSGWLYCSIEGSWAALSAPVAGSLDRRVSAGQSRVV